MTPTRNRSGLPINLIDDFWDNVVGTLHGKHGLGSVQALRAVLRFRNALDADEVGDILYHASPEDVAEGIMSGGYAKR